MASYSPHQLMDGNFPTGGPVSPNPTPAGSAADHMAECSAAMAACLNDSSEVTSVQGVANMSNPGTHSGPVGN